MPWEDNLDDFERQLAADKAREAALEQAASRKDGKQQQHGGHREDGRHGHRHDHSRRSEHEHHHSSRRRDRHEDRDGKDADRHRHKRRRRSRDREDDLEDRGHRHEHRHRHGDGTTPGSKGHEHDEREGEREESAEDALQQEDSRQDETEAEPVKEALKRDAWMEAPSALELDYIQRPSKDTQDPIRPGSPRAKFELKIHEAELNKHHLQELAEGRMTSETASLQQPAEHEVDYEFGDSGSRWRMVKLQNVYREAEETGRKADEVALGRYGSLRDFDDAREEEIELDRRKSYGEGYVGKIKPSGELYEERRLDAGVHRNGHAQEERSGEQTTSPQIRVVGDQVSTAMPTILDPTALNRLRAQLMKARLKGLPEVARLEREYEEAQRASETEQKSDPVVLNVMESRMLAGNGRQEVKEAAKRRERERGKVEENEDMSIEDMVREERRTKGIFGNEDRRFAGRIAKDGKFSNDLEYVDDNAGKLAKRVHQSDAALRSSAIAQHRQTSSVLASCPLCHHEDRGDDPLPIAPVVALAHRTFLTLPTTPEISPHGGAVIVPLSHHDNLLHCDDDEWEEMRNFMKSLIRMYHSRNLGVLFYENAARPRQHRHAALNVVPVSLALAEDAPAFFRESILVSDDEWAQHRKIIDTRSRGRSGFRRSIAKEAPYFHVWTELDGGLGHVVEDERKWPKGDLFAREVLGGMLRISAETWRRQGRWDRSSETAARVQKFRNGWRQFDWTRVLVEDGGDP